MRKAKRSAVKVAVAVLCLAGALGTAGGAARAQNTALGVMDGNKINTGYTKLKNALNEMEQRKKELTTQLNARASLTQAEAGRFDALVLKKRSSGEDAEMRKLVQSGQSRGKEYTDLMAKATKNDGDKARIKAFEDERRRTAPSFQNIVGRVEESLGKVEADTEKQYLDRILQNVEQIARERKLVLVVSKQALTWNSPAVDITDELLSRLNKS